MGLSPRRPSGVPACVQMRQPRVLTGPGLSPGARLCRGKPHAAGRTLAPAEARPNLGEMLAQRPRLVSRLSRYRQLAARRRRWRPTPGQSTWSAQPASIRVRRAESLSGSKRQPWPAASRARRAATAQPAVVDFRTGPRPATFILLRRADHTASAPHRVAALAVVLFTATRRNDGSSSGRGARSRWRPTPATVTTRTRRAGHRRPARSCRERREHPQMQGLSGRTPWC